MRKLAFRREAELELDDAVIHYEQVRVGLGKELLVETRAALAAVKLNPQSFPVMFRDARRVLIHRFPYAIFFLLKPDAIVIIGVLHTSQSRWRLRGRK
jgi:toxin ParE1/3/4